MKKTRRLFLFILCALTSSYAAQDVRAPAVAGQFYPSDPGHLRQAIQGFLKDAVSARVDKPVGLVVPHAGYIFSGQICADAYKQVVGRQVDVVVILGTNHTTANFSRISIMPRGGYRTPLGTAQIDESITTALLAQDSDCTTNLEPQAREHSVEVQVPFVQTVFPAARIVPVVIGEPDATMCRHFGQVLARVVQDRKALIVASSDLSHYPAFADANSVDRQTLESMVSLDPTGFKSKIRSIMTGKTPNLATCACGEAPILALLSASRLLGATHGVVLSYANSGDTALGEEGRVVGYGAVVLAGGAGESETMSLDRPKVPGFTPLQPTDKKELLKIARDTIQRYISSETTPLVRGVPSRLDFPQGVFVTLKIHGELRGCIGHIPPDFPLGRAVGSMAMQSAFNDPRFPPLKPNELAQVEIEISALTPMKDIKGPGEIVVGLDGVVIAKEGRTAVFLPQVALEYKWGRSELLENLCRKAGLPPDGWKSGAKFYVFQADVFDEAHFH